MIPVGVEMSAAEYHADPCATPSLSSSIAHILCTRSPAHAWTAHPKLNPDFVREVDDKFDLGTAAHAAFLEGSYGGIEALDFPDFRTKDAKAARDIARADGKVPVLSKNVARVEAMVQAAHNQLDHHAARPGMFTDGQPEQTIIWNEGDVMCRARFDWLRDDLLTIDDYKTTSASANPESWGRTLFGIGADIQAAFYLRGLRENTGAEATFRWAVQETYPPYALSVISLSPDVLALAEKKVDYAIGVWQRCLKADSWPAYPTEIAYPGLPSYEEFRWLEKEEREAA